MGTIGVEWVQKYNGLQGNLSNTKAQAEGFYNTLSGTRRFNWGDDLAWDQDFEQFGEGTPSAGTDTIWADDVDFVFFSGHGSPEGFLFGKKLDDAVAKPTEITWGDRQLEWIALDACNVLQEDGVFERWGWPVFSGLHMILGFHTTTGDEPDRGRLLAQYLNAGWTVRQAWIKACQDTEGSGTQWAYLRADAPGTDTYNDHWWGKGTVSSNPTNPTVLYYARGACLQLGVVMTVSLSFPDVRTPNEVPVLGVRRHSWGREASSLVKAFEIDADLTDAGLWMIARGERSALELYAATPSFRYTRFDLDDEGASGEGAVDRETAIRLAEEWLNRFSVEPDPSLRYRTQGTPILHSVTEREVVISERERREPRSLTVGTDVNYAFEYDGLPLLGPGAKAKVSIHPTGAVSNAYRFARNLEPIGTTTIRSADELLERFAGSYLFADVTDETARARVDSVRFGWLTLPPTEHMNVLLPAIEVRGSLATEAQTYDFINYVAAAQADEAEEKANWHLNAHPGLLIA